MTADAWLTRLPVLDASYPGPQCPVCGSVLLEPCAACASCLMVAFSWDGYIN